MSRAPGFAVRPSQPDQWVGAAGPKGTFNARLTIDVTPELRGTIKVAAFRRGLTVADMLRELLAREFGDGAESRP